MPKRTNHIPEYYWLAGILLTTAIVFFPALFNQFQMQWDDQVHVVDNPFIKSWSFTWLKEIVTASYGYQYSPVNTFCWLIVHSMFGLNPMAFHATSLLFHLVNVVLVFFFVKNILAIKDGNKGQDAWVAGIVALVFAIHPIQVEVVAWVSANKVLLHATFYWAGLLAYLTYLTKGKPWWLMITLLCFVLSLGAKEQAVLFPLSIVLIDWYYGVILQRRILLEKIPFFLLAILFGYFSLVIFDRTGSGGHLFHPLHQRLALGAFSYLEYLFKIMVPVKISYLYFFPIKAGESLPWHFWLYPFLMVLMAWYVWEEFYRKGKRSIVFGWLLFSIHLSLFLHIIPLGRSGMIADRYVYMALPGLILAFTLWIKALAQKHRDIAVPILSLSILYIGILMVQSRIQTKTWYDSTTLKKELIEQIENAKRKRALTLNPDEDV